MTPNIYIPFLDVSSNPISGRTVTFTPVAPPTISSSYLAVGDPIKKVVDNLGYVTASLVPATYSISINTNPQTDFYGLVTGSTFTAYSASIKSGSVVDVTFNMIDVVSDYFNVKKLTLTPETNYPYAFSGSIITMGATSSYTNASGSVTFNNLVPGVIKCMAKGKVETVWYISVPGTGGAENGKDLIVVKPSKATKVKVDSADSTYVLTVASSDARYIQQGGAIDSASYAAQAATAISSSYALNSTYAITSERLGNRWTSNTSGDDIWIEGIIEGPSSRINYNSATTQFSMGDGSNRLNVTSSQAISASYSKTASYALNGGGSGTTLSTGSTYPITASWATNWNSSSVVSLVNTKQNSLATGSTVPFTSSWATKAITASNAISSSYAINSAYAITSERLGNIWTYGESGDDLWIEGMTEGLSSRINYNSANTQFSLGDGSNRVNTTASQAISASYSNTASWALNAINGGTTLITGSPYPITSSWATNAITASYLTGSNAVVQQLTASTVIITNTGTGPSLVVEDSASPDTTPFIVDASGNVGIGTATPATRLHLQSLSAPANQADIAVISFTHNVYANPTGVQIASYRDSAGDYDVQGLKFRIHNSESPTAAPVDAMTINGIGNVGIGTTTPVVKLSVMGDAVTSVDEDLFRLDNTAARGWKFTVGKYDATTPTYGQYALVIDQDAGAQTGDFVITGHRNTIFETGNVGIGTTSPLAKLHVLGVITASAVSASQFRGNLTGSVSGTASYATTSSWTLSSATALSADFSVISNLAQTALSADFAVISNLAQTALSADFAVLADTADSASYARTASYATTASYYNYTDIQQLNTTNSISSSWASSSLFTNQALFSSQSLFSTQSLWATQSLNSRSASWASASLTTTSSSYALTASYALNGGTAGSSLSTGSTYPITSSWAINAASSKTASFVVLTDIGGPNTEYTFPFVAGSTDGLLKTVGGSTSMLAFNTATGSLRTQLFIGPLTGSVFGTASWATTASFVNSASYAVNSTYAITSERLGNIWTYGQNGDDIWIEGMVEGLSSRINYNSANTQFSLGDGSNLLNTTASQAISASYAPGAPSVSASYATTASYALNGGGSGTTLSTGSTYPITSSWALNVVTASALSASSVSLTQNGYPLELKNLSAASDEGSFVLGFANQKAVGANNDSMIIGGQNTASLFVGGVIGFYNNVTGGEDTWCLGQANTAGNADLVIGVSNLVYNASGNGRMVIGASNYVNSGSTNNVVLGHQNAAYADYASIVGNNITNNSASSVQIGPNNNAKLHIGTTGIVSLLPVTASQFRGNLTGSVAGTASYAVTSSYISPYDTYGVIITGSANGITASFAIPNQELVIAYQAMYNFTASNLAPAGQVADILIYVSNSLAASSSLSFPPTWKNFSGGWPNQISGSKSAFLWLRCRGTANVMGTWVSE